MLIVHTLHAQAGMLTLQVKGIDVEKGGQLSVGIFLAKEFPKPGRELINRLFPITGALTTVTITDVPAGDYGIAVYQDIDSDAHLKTNLIGMPQEPIGFSRDARIHLAPPRFSDAAVRVEDGKTLALPITLR